MEGFRHYYEQALRTEDSIDWKAHSVNYGLFKKRLLFFRQRRSAVKSYLRNSPTSTIPESTLAAIIGPKSHTPPHPQVVGENQVSNAQGMYMHFVDDDYSSSSTDVPTEIFTGRMSVFSRGTEKVYKKSSAQKRISNTERNEVILFLTMELDKVALFYIAQWNYLSQSLIEDGPSLQLGREILELLAHCIINLMALRQCLIRYDAFVRTYGGLPILAWYMKKMCRQKNSLRKILFHEELNALIDTFLKESLFDTSEFMNQLNMLKEVDRSTQKVEALASRGEVELIDSFIHTLRHSLLLGAIEDRMLSLEPTYLVERGSSLTTEMKMVSAWREKSLRLITPKSQAVVSTYQYFMLALSILSIFFYCMNYYIVEPSSTMYVNALGAPDYISGMLIGMMPIAAMISAIGYAIWTNYSFRYPVLLSAALMLSGNIVYASALKYNSVWVALVGRFMTGLGAPKCIIRRFMADTTPVAMRTSVNAAFAMAIAVGSALGPAAAIILNRFDFIGWVPGYGMFLVNGMTG
jgi:Sugar (and other) transporter